METELTNEQRQQFLVDHGLTITAKFIPWKISRNKDEKDPTLNWKVTLLKDGKPILTTDFSAGYGHCKFKPKLNNGRMKQSDMNKLIAECNGESLYGRKDPNYLALDVWSNILMDASTIDYPTYEDWASEFSYNPDSRSGEKIYRDCLERALKLRAAMGDSLLNELREAFQGY